jgi:hypothetical protein
MIPNNINFRFAMSTSASSIPKSCLPVTVWSYKGFITTILKEFLRKYENESDLKNKIVEFAELKSSEFDKNHSVCGIGESICPDFDTCCAKCRIE